MKIRRVPPVLLLLCVMIALFSGCYSPEPITLSEEEQAILDNIWQHKSTWEKVSSGFSHEECNSVEFGTYNGDLIFISRYIGNASPMTGAALLREDCYYASANRFSSMDSWDKIHYRVGFLYGSDWSASMTKEDLEQIYLDYLSEKNK